MKARSFAPLFFGSAALLVACAKGNDTQTGMGGSGGTGTASSSTTGVFATGSTASSSSSGVFAVSSSSTGDFVASSSTGFGGTGGTGGAGSGGTGGTGGTGGSAPTGSCAMPTALGDTATVMGNTATGLTGETGSCVDFGGPVVVYEVTPSKNGTLEATITTSSMFTDLDFFARTTCADTATELDCENDGDTTTLTLAATAGTPIFLFVEADFVLTGGAFSLTTKLMPAGCGDGIVSGGEDCEPPNTTTCDATCHFKEVCGDGVDNDKNGAVDCEDAVCAANCGGVAGVCNNPAAFTSPATGATSGTTSNFAGTCTGSLSAEKVFTVTPPKPGLYTLTATPTGTADLGLYVRSDCADPTKELACANKNAGGVAETVTVPVDGVSPITLFVDGGKASEAGAFKLESSFQALTEVEPNETSASADAYAAPFIGNIDHAGDIDWISVNVATAGASITAVVDSGNGACVGGIDSQVEIYASDGTTVLGMNDDRATDKCSSLTVTAATAGTYFVKVRSSVANAPNATFVYGLSVSVM